MCLSELRSIARLSSLRICSNAHLTHIGAAPSTITLDPQTCGLVQGRYILLDVAGIRARFPPPSPLPPCARDFTSKGGGHHRGAVEAACRSGRCGRGG